MFGTHWKVAPSSNVSYSSSQKWITVVTLEMRTRLLRAPFEAALDGKKKKESKPTAAGIPPQLLRRLPCALARWARRGRPENVWRAPRRLPIESGSWTIRLFSRVRPQSPPFLGPGFAPSRRRSKIMEWKAPKAAFKATRRREPKASGSVASHVAETRRCLRASRGSPTG